MGDLRVLHTIDADQEKEEKFSLSDAEGILSKRRRKKIGSAKWANFSLSKLCSFRGREFLSACFLFWDSCNQHFGPQLHHIKLASKEGWAAQVWSFPEPFLSSKWHWTDPDGTMGLASKLDRGGKHVGTE